MRKFYYRDDWGYDHVITEHQIIDRFFDDYVAIMAYLNVLPMHRAKDGKLSGIIPKRKGQYKFKLIHELQNDCINQFIQTFKAYEITGDIKK